MHWRIVISAKHKEAQKLDRTRVSLLGASGMLSAISQGSPRAAQLSNFASAGYRPLVVVAPLIIKFERARPNGLLALFPVVALPSITTTPH